MLAFSFRGDEGETREIVLHRDSPDIRYFTRSDLAQFLTEWEGAVMRQTFRQEEAEEILRRAITRTTSPTGALSGDVSEERLQDMAQELGVDATTLAAAVREWQEEKSVAAERAQFIRERHAGFWPHFWSYVGVNGFLVAINLLTWGGYFWVIWPMMGWGLGLFLHGINELPTRGAAFESDFEKWRKKRRKKAKKDASADET